MSDQSEIVEEVEGLENIFVQMSRSVIGVQQKLDGPLGLDYLARCSAPGQARLYSIPQITVELEFGLTIKDRTKVFLIFAGKDRTQEHKHHLMFSLVAVSEPPPDFPDQPPTALPFYLIEPHFLLSPDAEKELYQRLIAALENSDKWESALPGSKQLKPTDIDEEIKRIDEAFAKDSTDFQEQIDSQQTDSVGDKHSEQSRERGLVFFRLDSAPVSYLIVRVTGKSKNDSLFVLTPDASPDRPEVEIYSLEGDDTSHLRYRPLHLLGLTLRHWLEGTPPLALKVAGGPPGGLGLEDLQLFATFMRDGYTKGLQNLSTQRSDTAFPVFYDLVNVSAELSYSIDYDKSEDTDQINNPRFNFESGDEQDYKLIQSRALIRALREGNSARMEVELAAPEFALAGAARARFLEYFGDPDSRESPPQIVGDICKSFGKSAVAVKMYEGFMMNKSYRQGVVVLLSYKGQKPKPEFMVIWPGAYEGQPRDFVFTCKSPDGEDSLKLTRPIMGVEDSLADVDLNGATTAKADLSDEQYQAFHNFFHAVRIWRARVAPRRKAS